MGTVVLSQHAAYVNTTSPIDNSYPLESTGEGPLNLISLNMFIIYEF